MNFGNAPMGVETAQGQALYEQAMREFHGEVPVPVAKPEPEPVVQGVDPMLQQARDLLAPYYGREAVEQIETLLVASEFIDSTQHLTTLGDDSQRFGEWLDAYHALEATVDEMANETVRAEALAESASVEIAGFVPGALMARAEAVVATEVAEEEVTVSENQVMAEAVSLSYASNLKDLRAAAKVAKVRGRSKLDRIGLCSALGIPVPAPEEESVNIVSRAKAIAKKVAGPSFAEKCAYFREEHGTKMHTLSNHVLRQHPDGVKGHKFVPNHRIQFTMRVVNEKTGEVKVHTWDDRGCFPHKWFAAEGLTVRLIAS